MEEGLLLKEGRIAKEDGGVKKMVILRWRDIGEEIKTVSWLAGPMVAVVMSQYLLQVISMMMVGHLGQLYLSSAALAVSFACVTGFSLLVCFFLLTLLPLLLFSTEYLH